MYEKVVESELPRVSVVVPCLDEAVSIEACLTSLIAGDYPNDWVEILVVDGGSSDGTRQLVEQMGQQYPLIRLLTNPCGMTSAGLNIGIQAASGDIILITSAHARYSKGYISRSVSALEVNAADCVGGPVTALPSASGIVAEAIAMALSCRFGVGNARFRVSSQPGRVDTVAYGAYRREVFARIGLFDERLVRNQDIEFNYRLRRAGGKIYMAPEIRSYYCCRASLAGLWKQSFQNGKWNVYTVALVGRSLSWRHFAPLGFVTGLFGSGLLALRLPTFGWLFGGITTSYIVSAVIAALRTSGGRHAGSRALLPLVFLVLHLSYGLGSLWGIVTLARVRRYGH